ncbi:hypothetical protein GW17_00002093 [Ensete ventricosum]|nr:hypothetical protein GW17_00002093 [Ensete ventricosum]
MLLCSMGMWGLCYHAMMLRLDMIARQTLFMQGIQRLASLNPKFLLFLLISIIITCRYPPHGRRTTVMEEGVQRDRLRAPPVDTPARDLHISDCLNDLRPGDHIEIQWRRSKEFPYGGCFVIDLPSWL